ncbi:glycosyltransferase [Cryobacterium sp. BB736]|uniref:glycosyltransferase n=1 Tax=Cryobacterium sp. BB736 TaxID=2746963 RepID=UPI001873F2A8
MPEPAGSITLPPGRQLALTWSIPRTYGGMTGALLRRSRAFVSLAGASVDVLTFDYGRDYDAVITRETKRGTLIPGIRIVNLWDYLESLENFDDFPTTATAPELTVPERLPRGTIHRLLTRQTETRMAADGTTELQVDHYRRDGTLLAIDLRDRKVRGTVGGRQIVLFDREGNPVRIWRRIWQLYAAWLDHLIGDEPAIAIVDSKIVARFARTYNRPNVTKVHVIHNSHLATAERPFGPLRPSRAEVLTNLHDFDAVVALTHRQREDIEVLLGPTDNLVTIPNAVSMPDLTGVPDRDPSRGIMLATLDSRKRIDHAIRAVAAVGAPATLDIYGAGTQRARLARLIAELGAADRIHLRGFEPDARRHFQSASFLLLTSEFEGFPLVLQEGMAAECIPIAYDIPYGPSDIIRHGVNGFLVPAGDIDAVAGCVTQLIAMPEPDRERMRDAARSTALQFTDEAITRRWAAELDAAVARKQVGGRRFTLVAGDCRLSKDDDGSVRVSVTLKLDPARVTPDEVTIALAGSQPLAELRAPAELRSHWLLAGRYTATAVFSPDRIGWLGELESLEPSALVRSGASVRRASAGGQS